MEEKEREIMQVAMAIILHAGDAREDNLKAIQSLKNFEREVADTYLKEAEVNITNAHKIQTDQIQEETRGKKSEYSLLFAHAQDTLMTINSEILLVKSFMDVFNAYEDRIANLEAQLSEMKRVHE